MTLNDCFDLLGVTRESSVEEVKTSFRNLAKKYHPDVNEADGANEQYMAIRTAYDTILEYYKFKEEHYGEIEQTLSQNTRSQAIKERVKRANEKKREQDEAIQKFYTDIIIRFKTSWRIKYVGLLSVISTILSIVLIYDNFANEVVTGEKIVYRESDNDGSDSNAFHEYKIYLSSEQSVYVDKGDFMQLTLFDNVNVLRSPILHHIKRLNYKDERRSINFEIIDIFSDFMIMIAAILLLPLICMFYQKANFLSSVIMVHISMYLVPILDIFLIINNLSVLNFI